MKPVLQTVMVYSLLFLSLFMWVGFLAYADEIDTDTAFSLVFDANEAFAVQDLDHADMVTFTVQSGDLNGTATLTVTDDNGTLSVTPTTDGVIYITHTAEDTVITINGVAHTAPFSFTSGVAFTAFWEWTETDTLPEPDIDITLLGGDVSLLMTYLQQGDLLGFLFACYTTKLGQIFYVILTLMFTVPLALRTQSVTYVAIVWLVLAGVFQAAVPLIAPASVLLSILAIASLVYRAFTRE